MVNKQYTVQPARKQPNTYTSNIASTVTIIPSPDAMNPTLVGGANNLDQYQNRPTNGADGSGALQTLGGATYARNIAYVHNHGPNNNSAVVPRAEVTDVMFASAAVQDGGINNLDKDAAIKDIGRFQYILQMDREMVS